MPAASSSHEPVLLPSVLAALDLQPGQTVVDGTLGGGGYARAIIKQVSPGGLLMATDLDATAIARAEHEFAGQPVMICQANYAELPEVLTEAGIDAVDAIVLDLGLSSDQLADDTRGFSFHSDGELDMRFDTSRGKPAWNLLQHLGEKELADLIYQYGEERFSRRIARTIVSARKTKPITAARELAELVHAVIPSKGARIDTATKTFQALRIAVNRELDSLDKALTEFPRLIKPGGRLAIVSFHSLEDRRVKNAFRDDPRYDPIFRKPVVADEQELARNPRARSAKLRAAAIIGR